jgi:hypothetical protein
LDCGSPLPLFHRKAWQVQSGRGLPQSKTLARNPLNTNCRAEWVFGRDEGGRQIKISFTTKIDLPTFREISFTFPVARGTAGGFSCFRAIF